MSTKLLVAWGISAPHLRSYISHEEALSSPPLYLSLLISSGVPYGYRLGGLRYAAAQQ